jgi:hypothetical protein
MRNIEELLRGLLKSVESGRPDLWLRSLPIYLAFTLSIALTATFAARWAVQNDLAVRA